SHAHNISFDRYLSNMGGVAGLLFDKSEVAMGILMMGIRVEHLREQLGRSLLDTFGFIFLVPIPRAILSWKPRSADYAVSSQIAKESLVYTRSEYAIGFLPEIYV